MTGSDNPDPARGQNPVPPNPTRVWVEIRGVWQEAMTICRSTRGTFEKKCGDEPHAQLVLPFKDRGAA